MAAGRVPGADPRDVRRVSPLRDRTFVDRASLFPRLRFHGGEQGGDGDALPLSLLPPRSRRRPHQHRPVTSNVKTLALDETFGRDFSTFAEGFTGQHSIDPSEVGRVILALASGLLDGVSGQIITVDRGITFFDNIMHLYHERDRLGLQEP